MRHAHLISFSLLLALGGCGGDDGNKGSGSSGGSGTAGSTGMCPRGFAGSGGQCPATGGTMSDSASATSQATITAGSTTATTATTTTTTTTATTGMSGGTGVDCAMGCVLDTTWSVIQDPCGHYPYVGLGSMEMVPITIMNDQITIEVLGEPGLDPSFGTIDPMTGAFTAQGSATVAGNPFIEVEWMGTFDGMNLDTTLRLGAAGGLPGGCPIDYNVATG